MKNFTPGVSHHIGAYFFFFFAAAFFVAKSLTPLRIVKFGPWTPTAKQLESTYRPKLRMYWDRLF